eukprot:m.55332 g.55332  ORF g.55332 m.55332 type:complete len:296 (-) comp18621_c0_seq2:125-1012(-)
MQRFRSFASSSRAYAASLTKVSSNKMFGGHVERFRHSATTTQCDMGFAVFLPPAATSGAKLPTLYWLSGLTCDDTNFMFKAGAQQHLANLGMMVVCPDTSPRGCNIEGEEESYDFGTGAGFYLNATTPNFKTNYNMFDYVTKELPKLIQDNFPCDSSKQSIFGHSMGGLGALNCFLKTEGVYQSVSAFAPICNPTSCDWGKKAFTGYLGDDEPTWKSWDPSSLLAARDPDTLPSILISQGEDDEFLTNQLRPDSLPKNDKIIYEAHAGYDHSYYFIATFIQQHINHHATALGLSV